MLIGLVAVLVISAASAGAYLLTSGSPDKKPPAASAAGASPSPGDVKPSGGDSGLGTEGPPQDSDTLPLDPGTTVSLLPAVDNVTAPKDSGPSTDAGGTQTLFWPPNLTDGQSETAWRMKGDGSGQQISLTWTRKVTILTVGLINGYAKVDPFTGDDRYPEERRVTQVTWLLDGRPVATQQLPDTDRQLQTVDLPQPATGSKLVLRIDSTAKPGKADHDYTAISEIAVIGGTAAPSSGDGTP